MWQTESVVPHSAKQFGEIEKHNEQIRNADILHKSKLEKGAEASIEQKELVKDQVDLLYQQNRLLSENYDKLKELYEMQRRSTEDAKAELRKTQIYNACMMVISIVSMLMAVISAVK